MRADGAEASTCAEIRDNADFIRATRCLSVLAALCCRRSNSKVAPAPNPYAYVAKRRTAFREVEVGCVVYLTAIMMVAHAALNSALAAECIGPFDSCSEGMHQVVRGGIEKTNSRMYMSLALHKNHRIQDGDVGDEARVGNGQSRETTESRMADRQGALTALNSSCPCTTDPAKLQN